MQVSIESISKTERRVTITIPSEKYDEAFEKRIGKLAKTAKVPGFRPGKVPLSYVKTRYGEHARQEALSEIIQSSFYDAITQEKINPIGTPRVEPKEIVPGQPLEFIATFEVLPEIETIRFDAGSIEKVTAQIGEDDVNKVLERLSEQHIVWKKVDRAAQLKDQVVMDYEVTHDGKAIAQGKASNYPLVLGSKMMIAGFEEGLIGAKAGDKKVLHLTFPETYFAKDIAGKVCDFTIQVKQVSEPELPAMDENFIKKLGVKSGKKDDLLAEVRKNLERQLDYLTKAKLKTIVFDKLLEQNSVEVPKALIEKEAKRIHDELHPHHKNDEAHSHSEAEMASFNEKAKQNVALRLIFDAYVKQQNLVADKARVKTFIDNIAAAYENSAKMVNWYTGDKRRLAQAEMQVLEDQVVEKLLEGVSLKEKMLSYNEFVNH